MLALEGNVSTLDTGVSTAFDNTLQRTIMTVIGLIALSLVAEHCHLVCRDKVYLQADRIAVDVGTKDRSGRYA